jgi:Domain of unknown function (DUF6438)
MNRNKKVLLTFSLLLTLLFSCKQKPKKESSLKKICFAVGGCYGTCPLLSIELDSTLTYKFYGGQHSKKIGWYKGNVTQGFWDTLNINLERINYKKLDTTFEQTVDDASFEIILYYDNKRKHINAQEMSMPDSVRYVFTNLAETYKNLNLTKQTDSSFSIETKIQNGVIAVPPPPIKFKPPKRKK